MKILSFFLFLGVIFALLDPDTDPAAQINADPDPKPWPPGSGSVNQVYGSGSRRPIIYGSTDPNPKEIFTVP